MIMAANPGTLEHAKQSLFISVRDVNTGEVSRIAVPADMQIGLLGNPAELQLLGRFSLNSAEYSVDRTHNVVNVSNDVSFAGIVTQATPTAGNINAYLPPNPRDGQLLIVKDMSGIASQTNINVYPGAPDQLIDDIALQTMTTAYGSLMLCWLSGQWRSIATGGGGSIKVENQGTLLSSSSFTTFNFSGSAVTAIDQGGGTALILISGTTGAPGPTGSAGASGIFNVTGSGWTTVMDIDFTTMASASFTTDGYYSIGSNSLGQSLTWGKANSSHEVTHVSVGTTDGMVFNPIGNTPFSAYTIQQRTAPLFSCSLANISNLIDWGTCIRVFVDVGTWNVSNPNGANSYVFIATDNGTTSSMTSMAYGTRNSGGWDYEIDVGSPIASQKYHQLFGPEDGSFYIVTPSVDGCWMMEFSNLMQPPLYGFYHAAVSSGPFPSLSTFKPLGMMGGGTDITYMSNVQSANPTIANMAFVFGAAVEPSVTLTVSIKRLRIDINTGGGTAIINTGSFITNAITQSITQSITQYVDNIWFDGGNQAYSTGTIAVVTSASFAPPGTIFYVSGGAGKFMNGITGSLTQTPTAGNPFIVGTGTIAITTNSLGQIIISGSGGGAGTITAVTSSGGTSTSTVGSVVTVSSSVVTVTGNGGTSVTNGGGTTFNVSSSVGADPTANYILYTADAQLPNALILTSSGGTSLQLLSRPNLIVSSAVGADLYASYLLASGSAQDLKARTLAAGSGISLVDGGPGSSLTITAIGGGTGGGGSVWVDGNNKAYTTSSIAIDPRGLYATTDGVDTWFYVSGTIGLTGSAGRKSVFGGDVYISGSAFILGGLTGSITQTSGGLAFIVPLGPGISISTNSLGQIVVGNTKTGDDKASYLVLSTTASLPNDRSLAAGTGIVFTDLGPGSTLTISANGQGLSTAGGWTDTGHGVYTTSSVSIDSQGRTAGQIGTDVYLFVSGAHNNGNKALFGGDVFVSGSLTAVMGLSGSLTTLNTGLAYLVAGPNVTVVTNSLGQVIISGSAGGSVTGSTEYRIDGLPILAGAATTTLNSGTKQLVGSCYFDATKLNKSIDTINYTFRASLAPAGIGGNAYVDLYDYNGIVRFPPGPIVGAVLTGSAQGTLTRQSVSLTPVLSSVTGSGILAARAWIDTGGTACTITDVGLDLEWL